MRVRHASRAYVCVGSDVVHGADFNAKDSFGRSPLEEAEFEAPGPTIELMRNLTSRRATTPKP